MTNQVTIYAAGQSLTQSNSTCLALFKNGSTTLTSPTGGDLVINVTPGTSVAVQ
ncbi:hypothetical protein [Conexibacter woesei]|uniref:hypothetical protein n=1 Tax=Conexibacter woesei TaxID=191495 RepID=UPI0012DD2E95|nr:hypothetical protein [Conexibacter woesei]